MQETWDGEKPQGFDGGESSWDFFLKAGHMDYEESIFCSYEGLPV